MIASKLHFNTEIVNNNDLDRKLFILLAVLFTILSATYIFYIGKITFAVVDTRSLNNQVRTLRGDVGDLELKYLSLNGKVDMAFAEAHGFSEPSDTYFAQKTRLSVNTLADHNDI